MNKINLICMSTSLCLTPLLHAQNFSGTFAANDPQPYANLSSQFTVSNFTIDGTIAPIWDNAVMYCLDYDADSLAQKPGWTGVGTFSGNVVTLSGVQAWSRHTGDNQDVAVASAQILYAIDHYYQQVLDSGTALDNRAFALTIWELAYDGGGSNQGIDITTGNFNRTLNNAETQAAAMLLEIKNANVQASYTSKSNFLILDDPDNTYQDYIMISQHDVGVVPEPSSSFLLSITGIFCIFRRNRK